jgi:5-formyltetrahydrofolate cyclo-ligase
MLKAELRKIYKQQRFNITEKEYEKYNDLILLQLQTLELPFLHQVLSYFPIEENNEPDTFLITRYLKFMNPQLEVAYPRIKEDGSMDAISKTNDSEFTANYYGISELQEGEIMPQQEIDLVLVPLLICDYNGNRVGYGKGFYDKYLSLCRKDVIKIGLSFFDPVASISDVEEFDVPLTYCITPDIVYAF